MTEKHTHCTRVSVKNTEGKCEVIHVRGNCLKFQNISEF